MKDYTHYFDIAYTDDQEVFNREFTNDEYKLLDTIYDTRAEAEAAAHTIAELVPEAERIEICYNIIEFDTEDLDYYKCLTCVIVADYTKVDGKWNFNEDNEDLICV